MKRTDLPIPSPCTQDWDTMTAAGRKRFCAACKKHVHDLSSLSPEEAKALLAAPPAEGLCVRYLYDEHGSIVFSMVDTTESDSPSAFASGVSTLVPASALLRAGRALASTAAVAGVAAALAGCMGAPQPKTPVYPMMGEPALTPPTTTATARTPEAPIAAPSGTSTGLPAVPPTAPEKK